jgi:hypothetical protein
MQAAEKLSVFGDVASMRMMAIVFWRSKREQMMIFCSGAGSIVSADDPAGRRGGLDETSDRPTGLCGSASL